MSGDVELAWRRRWYRARRDGDGLLEIIAGKDSREQRACEYPDSLPVLSAHVGVAVKVDAGVSRPAPGWVSVLSKFMVFLSSPRRS